MDNKSQDKDLTLKSLKRLYPYAKKYWIRGLIGFVIAIPVGGFDALIAQFLQFYTDYIIVAKEGKFSTIIPAAIISVAVLQAVLTYMTGYFTTWFGTKISTDIKKDLYTKLVSQDSSYFDVTQSGLVLQRYYNDADMASTSLMDNLRQIISRTVSSAALVVVLFYNSWQLAVIAVIVLTLAIVPAQKVRRKMKGVVNKTVLVNSEAVTAYNETYQGNKIIASYNLSGPQIKKYNSVMDATFSLGMRLVKYTNWLSPLMHIIVAVGLAAVLFYANGLIIKGTISSGNFTAFIAALLMLYTPLKSMGNKFVELQKSFMAIERIFELFSLEPKIQDRSGARGIKNIRSSIEFKNVYFEYKPGIPVLKNINVKVPVGKTIALVGNSGGGKSTFVNLIPRFYDVTKGGIFVDGKDVRDITLHSLRSQIAVVFQDNFLFSGTIKDNILMGRPGASERQLKQAVRHAHLEDFLNTLPLGIDTVIGERGASLSGGQRQRVGIARAFLKDAPVVVLDEATSALDNKSEAVVQKAIDELMKDRTVFVIAHRLSTVQNADEILVINEGEIVERGTHKELLSTPGGAYHALYNAQFRSKGE